MHTTSGELLHLPFAPVECGQEMVLDGIPCLAAAAAGDEELVHMTHHESQQLPFVVREVPASVVRVTPMAAEAPDHAAALGIPLDGAPRTARMQLSIALLRIHAALPMHWRAHWA